MRPKLGFLTRPDTIFGATFMVLAPENPLVSTLTTAEQKSEVENYIEETSKKRNVIEWQTWKTFLELHRKLQSVNPFTGKNIPIYISDYVLMGWELGAVIWFLRMMNATIVLLKNSV